MIVVTGANGFVGRSLRARLAAERQGVRAAIRTVHNAEILPSACETVVVSEIGPATSWGKALNGVDTIVHLAGRVHVMHDTSGDPLEEFRRVNVDGTLNLARQAAAKAIKRFIFLSSIKVNGEATQLGHPFTEQDVPLPQDPYSISKYEAEQGLIQLAAETEMAVTIIRSPLVYGPGVKANFQRMMRWVNKSVPLPFGAIHNQRSLLGLDNLVDFILTCIDHPAAANQVFLVADGEDLSTTDLMCRVGRELGKPARLIPVPPSLLQLGAALLGKRAMVQRLCGSLQVDISKARELLGWTPPVSVDEGLRRTVEEYSYSRDFEKL